MLKRILQNKKRENKLLEIENESDDTSEEDIRTPEFQKTSSDQKGKPVHQLYGTLRAKNTMNSSKRGNRFGISTFIVNFHASLHAALHIKPCKIYVRFALYYLGGWKSLAHEMHIVREYENGNVQLRASVSIPRRYLNVSILYKYCIVYDDNRKIEECIYNNPNNTRYLCVLSSELMGDGIFHQYNGVIRGPSPIVKGITDYLWKISGYNDIQMKRNLLKDLDFSANIFLPVLPSSNNSFEGSTGEEFSMLVHLVRKGLLACYRDYCSQTEFDMTFCEKKGFKEKDHRIKVLVSAVTEIYLIYKYKLFISYDERDILCRTLLPEDSQENSCCPDVECLRDAFASSFQ
ncbi:unnamed protein product [Mytilus edulis]|uniref:Uncharacterized protein n=1 Tax=Mytilus edulis TaxID=6550 RepID=A0A8S3SXL5_MYTED|nr:unnamed protein product [Mytilus edulis]